MLFQMTSSTFFSGLPNNDHPEAGHFKKPSVLVLFDTLPSQVTEKQCQQARHILT